MIEMQNGNAPKATRALNEEYPENLKVSSQMVACQECSVRGKGKRDPKTRRNSLPPLNLRKYRKSCAPEWLTKPMALQKQRAVLEI